MGTMAVPRTTVETVSKGFAERANAALREEDLEQVPDENWNAVPLAEGAWFTHVLFTTKPVVSADAFQSMKIHVHNPETAQFIAGFGARPTPLNASEIAVGLGCNLLHDLSQVHTEAGDQLQVHVTSSNFPCRDRNFNTREPEYVGTTIRVAQQRILHDSVHPSRVDLQITLV
jgi:hypothetical protein